MFRIMTIEQPHSPDVHLGVMPSSPKRSVEDVEDASQNLVKHPVGFSPITH